MDNTQFEREVQYGAAVAIAKQLLHRELITQSEYQTLTLVLTQKYHPPISSPRIAAGNPAPKMMDGRTKSERRTQSITPQ